MCNTVNLWKYLYFIFNFLEQSLFEKYEIIKFMMDHIKQIKHFREISDYVSYTNFCIY